MLLNEKPVKGSITTEMALKVNLYDLNGDV